MQPHTSTSYDDIVSYTNSSLGYDCHIALQGTSRGPAIGGCRVSQYHSSEAALADACALATAMLRKAHIHDLPHGGGKAVINLHNDHASRTAIMSDFAKNINRLNGKYITAIDVGSTQADMDIIHNISPYVVCTSAQPLTAHYTALGVYQAIKLAAAVYLNKSLNGLRFNIQGIGAVGSELVNMLQQHSKNITICDLSNTKLAAFSHLNIVSSEDIYKQPADCFIPCAMGGVITQQHINMLDTKIICGAANNQLAATAMDAFISEKGMIYMPDFMVNAGGLIYASHMYNQGKLSELESKFNNMNEKIKYYIEKSVAASLSPLRWLQTNYAN